MSAGLSSSSSPHLNYQSIQANLIPQNEEISITDSSDIRLYYKKKSEKSIAFIIHEICNNVLLIILGLIITICFLLLAAFVETWRELSWQGWFTIAVTVISLLILIGNLLSPGFVFLAAMTVCYLFGIINTAQAFEGFSNSGVMTIGALVCFFVVQ